MALQKQKFAVSFSQGVDTKTDDKQVVPGKLLSLENGILTKTGKVIKRNGYSQLGNVLYGGSALATYQDELIAFDGTDAYSYSASTNSFYSKGSLDSLRVDSVAVIRNTNQQTNADSVIHSSGIKVFTWTDSRGSCRYSIADSISGQILVNDTALSSTSINAKPVALGNYVLIFYYDTATQHISFLPIPAVVPTNPSSVIDASITVKTANPNYDVCVIGDRAFLAFNSSTGGGSIGVCYVNFFLQVSSIVSQTGENCDTCVTVFGDNSNSNVYVAYYNGTAVKYFVRDYALTTTAVLSPTIIETVSNVKNITGLCTSGVGQVYYTITAAATYNYNIRTNSITVGGTVGTAAVFIRSVALCGKAFYYNSERFLPTVFETSLQPTIFILNQNAVVVAKLAALLAGGITVNSMLSNVSTLDDINFLLAYTKKDLLDSVNGNIYTQTGVNSTNIEFISDNSFLDAELGANLHTTGGILQMYDGVSFVEHGFNYYPENLSNSINTGAGSITAGTRQYVVTYEWLDNQGQVHRSTTSVPLSVTNIGATNTNTLTIPTLRLTEKKGSRTKVQIVIYRTVDAGTVFYQVSSTTSPTFNDTTVDSITYADNKADSAIIGSNFLYTTGGVMDNAQAEATNIISTFKSRLFYVPSEDPYSYNFSKQVVPGTPVEFYDQQALQIDQRGGPIKAIATLDDKFIFFKESAIFYMTGDGPDSTGAQDDFSIPQLITTDGGCIDVSSVVSMPLGIMYKSQKGIYVLTRSLNIEYIGKDVEYFNDYTILSSVLISNKNQVRFSLEGGTVIVYDYFVGQWYTFTNHNLLKDAISWQNSFVYLKSNGQVYQEDDSYTDNGNPIKMKIKTGWFSLAGLQGFQRIYKLLVLGNYVSKHNLKISVSYDFNDVLVNDVVIDAYTLLDTEAYGVSTPYGSDTVYGGNFPLYQFRYNLPRQKCESLQVTIEDIQSDEIGEGYQLSNLAFEVGIKQGLNKVGLSRTFS